MSVSYEAHSDAAKAIQTRITTPIDFAIILGSFLGELIGVLTNPVTIPFSEIPHYPDSMTIGHDGKMVIGQIGDRTVCMIAGRSHMYEGRSLDEIVFSVRVMSLLNVPHLMVTNIAGGINKEFEPGALMQIVDHISMPGMAGFNPLVGPNDERFGPRFIPATEMYHQSLGDRLQSAAAAAGVQLHTGIYVGVGGPSFETPAEIRFLRSIGGDSVGMSTVHEVVAANHCGMKVCGISSIANVAVDTVGPQTVKFEDEFGPVKDKIVTQFQCLIQEFFR